MVYYIFIIINFIYCLHASSWEDMPKFSNLYFNLWFPLIFKDAGLFSRTLVVDLFKATLISFNIRPSYQI